MMIDKKGHKCRNIQEQVGKNTCDIKELKQRTPETDFVIKATKSDDGKTLSLLQRVDGEEGTVEFQGGKDIIAGRNIHVEHLPEGEKISAVTEPVGTVAFENIVGEPRDNEALNEELEAIDNALENAVTLNTNQSITGQKTFFNANGVSVRSTPLSAPYANYTDLGIKVGSTGSGIRSFTWPDASGQFATTEQLEAYHDATKQDKLTAGTGITISAQNVISAQIPTNIVTTNTEQQISGTKHFTNVSYGHPITFHTGPTTSTGYIGFSSSQLVKGPQDGTVTTRLSIGNTDGTIATTADVNNHHDSTKQDKLTAGENITIVNNVISATGGGGTGDYEDLENKPQIEGVELIGNKSASALGLATATSLNSKQDKVDASIVSPMPNTVVGALNYLEGAKQDELVSGTNIKTINSQSLLGAGNIQISGEPEVYIKSASVSGNTLTLTKQDDTDISFTPTGQEGGITDVRFPW